MSMPIVVEKPRFIMGTGANEKARFIMGTGANEKAINNMVNHIEGKSKAISRFGVDFDTIEKYKKVDLKLESIRFNYCLSEIYEFAKKYTKNKPEDLENVLLTALTVCGIRIQDSEAAKNVRKASSSYKVFERYLRVPGIINKRRLTMRVVPEDWGGYDSPLCTRFELYGKDIYIDNEKVAELSALSTAVTIQNIAYMTKSTSNEYILTLNPNQICSQDCKFCFKGYHHMTLECKSSLIYLSPKQLCKYIQVEFPHIDFAEISEVAILTSRFANAKQLLDYIEDFLFEIKVTTSGKFDPLNNEHQRVKVSTHLLNSEETMLKARKMGIKRYIYPIEAFNSDVRKNIMTNPNRTENKGDISFDEIMIILEKASKIFGKENIEPVIIIGLDTYEDTINNVKRLKEAGYTMLTRSIFRIYDNDQFNLYKMNLEEIIAANEEINILFPLGYKQVVELNDNKVNTNYKA
jgi:hypothetical protein